MQKALWENLVFSHQVRTEKQVRSSFKFEIIFCKKNFFTTGLNGSSASWKLFVGLQLQSHVISRHKILQDFSICISKRSEDAFLVWMNICENIQKSEGYYVSQTHRNATNFVYSATKFTRTNFTSLITLLWGLLT